MRTRRLFLGAIIVGSLLLSLASGFYATSRLFYVLITAVALAWVWTRLSLRGIRAGADQRTALAQVGDWAEERVWIQNDTNLPRPWVHVQDLGDVPGLPAEVAGLTARGYRSWTLRAQCRRRGRFTWGPVQLTAGDPLGLFQERRVVPEANSLVVYPAPVPLDEFYLSVSDRSGDATEYRATSQITPNVVTIRRYVVGDSLNRIHWKSSAKRNRLMVKEFETETHSDLWILLDLAGAAQIGTGEEGTEEAAVTIAASLARHLLDYDNSVGFLAVGEQEYLIPPGTREQHLWRILEVLATCRARGRRSLREVLSAQATRFTRQTGLIAITPSVQDALAAGSFIAERSASGAVVVLEPMSFGGRENALPLLGNLLALGLAVYLVRRGDVLSQALSFSALGPTAIQAGARRGFQAPGRWGQ